jgi:hypothetical protein
MRIEQRFSVSIASSRHFHRDDFVRNADIVILPPRVETYGTHPALAFTFHIRVAR